MYEYKKNYLSPGLLAELRQIIGEALMFMAVGVMSRSHPHREIWVKNQHYAALEIAQELPNE